MSKHGTGARAIPFVVVLVLATASCSSGTTVPATTRAVSQPRGDVAATPPMGWNSWNTFRCDIDEALIRRSADALVSSGMAAAGYRYVVVDDCWMARERTSAGRLRADPKRFPHGMAALGRYVHRRGLRFGIYSAPGPKTCAQRNGSWPGATGSYGHEQQDAATFAAWGVDYLKYDLCTPNLSLDETVSRFRAMRDALAATGRPIVYSINPNSYNDLRAAQDRDWSDVADQWRISQDISPFYDTHTNRDLLGWGVLDIADLDAPRHRQAGPGHWNDPDMLVAGVSILNGQVELSPQQARTHLGLWAMLAAPLIAGNDVRTMEPWLRTMLTNRRVVAIDQDPLGHQARRVRHSSTVDAWARPLAGGDRAILLVNRTANVQQVTVPWKALGVARAKGRSATDAWTGAKVPLSAQLAVDLPPYGSRLLRVG